MENRRLRLLCVLAHPDDESLGAGGILAKYAAEGVETYLVTATRGERGWFGPEADYPGPEALGKIREAELRAATDVLGIRELMLLDYIDGDLDQADPDKVVREITTEIRRIQPDVVVTFDPTGGYGHPDHIAICQFTTAAVTAAADSAYMSNGSSAPYRVPKLYYMAFSKDLMVAYEKAFGELVMNIDGTERRSVGWEDWAITTRIITGAFWETVWKAISCHRTQLPGYEKLVELPESYHQTLWGSQTYYRVLSLVNGGREVETDLFAGIREAEK